MAMHPSWLCIHILQDLIKMIEADKVPAAPVYSLFLQPGCMAGTSLEHYSIPSRMAGMGLRDFVVAQSVRSRRFSVERVSTNPGLRTTYVNCANTNKVVLRKANEEINRNGNGEQRGT